MNPPGWRVYAGLSTKGYPELVIASDREFWLLKRESLYTGKPGLAVRVGEPYGLDRGVAEFGFREIPRSALEGLRRLAERQADPIEAYRRVVLDILSRPPTLPGQAMGSGLLQGPVVHTGGPLPVLSQAQADLNARLEAELNRRRASLHYLA